MIYSSQLELILYMDSACQIVYISLQFNHHHLSFGVG